MTQKEQALQMFRENNNQLTLREIMKTNLGCEYRARFSDLRREGYKINCERAKKPSDNTYTLIEKGYLI